MEHYADFGNTFRWIDIMVRWELPNAAVALAIALISLVFAFFCAFMNRPVISGLLFITSGLLLIYMFNVASASSYFELLMWEWNPGGIGFAPPYSIGPSPYAIIFMGILFLFGQYYFKRKEPKAVT
jgi:hypothetical protein